MDRKIEVGDVYDFRGTAVHLYENGWARFAFRCDDSDGQGKDAHVTMSPDTLAHAILVKAAERPLKVGDMVRLPWWTNDAEPHAIAFIGGSMNEAVFDLGPLGLSRPYRLTELRRAETT